MRNLKITLFVSPILLLSLLIVVFAQQQKGRLIPPHRLGIEIGLSKPFTVTAPTAGHTLEAFVQVPTMATNESQGPFAAIKLSSKLVGDKLELTVSGLSGDATAIKSCKDWGALKESPIASYILGEGDQATVSQLSDLGPNFKNGRLTFKAITLKAAPADDDFELEAKCGCATCPDGLVCCPNPGKCVQCSNCAWVCCK
jgi:hypothetical protein